MENKSIPEPSILFVYDEEVIRKSLIRELQMERFAVTAATGGSEAVACLKEGQFDLVVITDLMMPGVDSFGALKAAKKIAPLTSVIILTNDGDMQYAIDAQRHGADDIVNKPCDIDELVSRIRHCLEKRNLLLKREQLMKALRESEERNRSIVNASPDGIIIADMEGQILMVSPAGVTMFGYDPDDKCQGHWVSVFIAPEDRGHALSNIATKVQNVKTGPNEYRGLRKDGSTFVIEVNNDFIRSAGGQLISIVFMVRDISERKRAEVALHESKIFNLAILNSLSAAIAVLDPDWVIIAVNDSWRRFALENGIETDKPVPNIEVGANYLSVCKAVTGIELDDALRSYKGIQSVLGGRLTNFNLEYPCHAPEQERWFSMDVTSLSLERKRGVVVVHTNITKLKKADEALRVSEEKYRTVANFSYAMETWRTPEGRYRYVSPSSERITGHKAEDFLADPKLLIQITHPDDQSKVIEHFLACNRSAEAQNMGIDFRILTPEGERRWLGHSSTAVHGRDGQFWGRRGSFREITKLKREEEAKEKREVKKLQLQKAESLGRMAAAIAHHFNNKLQVVMGRLELALKSLPQDDSIINDLTNAKQAVDEAADMSRLMLIYLGQVTGPRVLLNLSEICKKCLSQIQSTMPKNVVLQTDLFSPGPTIMANSKQIQLIITSLIANAWEAVGDNQGTILLSVKMVSSADIPSLHRFPVNWQPEITSYACLEIRDTGCGITDKDIEKAFDPFFSTKFVGRGLGLPVVLGLVQAHSGVVSVESRPGQGSVFRVFFPLYTAEVHLEPDKAARASEMQWSGTVLLVDDDKSILNLTRAMLTMLGFEVLSAGDGIEAVEIFRQHKNEIRFVLTDFGMPHMNGLETVTALRQIAPDIPVILASGYSKKNVLDDTHPERLQAFLGKPYSLQTLKDAIYSTLEDKQGKT